MLTVPLFTDIRNLNYLGSVGRHLKKNCKEFTFSQLLHVQTCWKVLYRWIIELLCENICECSPIDRCVSRMITSYVYVEILIGVTKCTEVERPLKLFAKIIPRKLNLAVLKERKSQSNLPCALRTIKLLLLVKQKTIWVIVEAKLNRNSHIKNLQIQEKGHLKHYWINFGQFFVNISRW